MAGVVLYPGARQRVERHRDVLDDAYREAQSIADAARDRTAVSDGPGGGDARDSVHAVRTPEGAAVVGGGRGSDGWHYVFQELGGQGFRPPPRPIVTEAESRRGNR